MNNNSELTVLKNKLKDLSLVQTEIDNCKKKIDKTSCDINNLTNVQVESNMIGIVSAAKINKSINSLKEWAARCFHLVLNSQTDQNKNIGRIAELIKLLAQAQVVIYREIEVAFNEAVNIEDEINRLCKNVNITDENLQEVLRISAKQAQKRQLEMANIKVKLFETQEYLQQLVSEIQQLKAFNMELQSRLNNMEKSIEQLNLNSGSFIQSMQMSEQCKTGFLDNVASSEEIQVANNTDAEDEKPPINDNKYKKHIPILWGVSIVNILLVIYILTSHML